MPVMTWGSEKIVNTSTAYNQYNPSVATLTDGNYVVAWEDLSPNPYVHSDIPSTSDRNVFAQRFDSAGNAVGPEMKIARGSTFTDFAFSQTYKVSYSDPSVAALPNGGFTVSVSYDTHFRPIWGDVLSFRIMGANIDSADNLLGTYSTSEASYVRNVISPDERSLIGYSDVTANGTGVAVVYEAGSIQYWDEGPGAAWEVRPFRDILLARYSANGTSLGTVNLTNTSLQGEYTPDIAELGNGNLVVVWNQYTVSFDWDSGYAFLDQLDIRLLVLDSTGGRLTADPIIVNTTVPVNNPGAPHVTPLVNGGFVVTWATDGNPAPGSGVDVRARLFDAAGVAAGNDFLVNTTAAGTQSGPEITALPQGGFVAIWHDGARLAGRIFDAAGVAVGTDFTVEATSNSFQTSALPDGRFVVTWQGTDSSGTGIHSQIFDPRNGMVNGTDGNDTLYGNDTVNDTINGGDGNDRLIGLGGADLLNGGPGIDTADYSHTTQGVVVNLAASVDQATGLEIGTDQLTSIENVTGGSGADTLSGDDGANVLLGNAGNDGLRGLGGNDVIDGGPGTDTVRYEEKAATVVVTLNGGSDATVFVGGVAEDTIRNVENVRGGSGDDSLTGDALSNLLVGLGGSDVIDGGPGIDTVGYEEKTSAVVVTLNGGSDATVFLGGVAEDTIRNVENVLGGSGNDSLTGDAQPNSLYGNGGTDTLNGGGGGDSLFGGNGDDVMNGGPGDDIYAVESTGGLVHEATGEGNDRIYSSGASYALAQGSEVEVLSTSLFADTTPVNLTGNEFRNALYGNAGVNVLNGGGGADTLTGFDGDDQYCVDDAGDLVIEAAGGGYDRVFASVSYALRAGQEVEKLTTTRNDGTTAINLTGNEFANVIYGNAGNNMLDGKSGADTLVGLVGDDAYYVDNGADVVSESAAGGNDRIFTSVSYALRAGQEVEKLTASDLAGMTAINLTGNEFANTIYANAGNNSLNGAGGVDTLVGLAGDDLYYVDNDGDQVYEHAGEGYDRVLASVSYTLKTGQEIEKFTTAANAGTAAVDLTGNELANTIYGNAGDNTLAGRYGNDTLVGLGGEDHFLFDTALKLGGNVDYLGDFSVPDGDKILLDHTIFTLAETGALPAEAFHVGTAASDADDRVIYNSSSGALFFDPDGTGAKAETLFAIITHPVALSASEFIVV